MLIIVKNGQIVNKEACFEFMSNIKDGEREIIPYRKDRSNNQNKYYRKILGIISDETGNDINDLHEKFKLKFLYVPESKTQLPYAKSTTKLTIQEFTKYIDQIKNFIANYGIILPNGLD